MSSRRSPIFQKQSRLVGGQHNLAPTPRTHARSAWRPKPRIRCTLYLASLVSLRVHFYSPNVHQRLSKMYLVERVVGHWRQPQCCAAWYGRVRCSPLRTCPCRPAPCRPKSSSWHAAVASLLVIPCGGGCLQVHSLGYVLGAGGLL